MDRLMLRIIHSHDTQKNWEALPLFVPKAGELIVYDIDEQFAYERFKLGDGVTLLKDLPFAVENIVETMFKIENNIIYADAGRITDYDNSTN